MALAHRDIFCALVPSSECVCEQLSMAWCELRVHRCQLEHTRTAEFRWEYMDWSVCTATCGGGTQVQTCAKNKFRKQNSVHIVFHFNLKFLQVSQPKCMEKEAGLVEETYCAALVKPEEKSRSCNKQSCPPRYVNILHFVVHIFQDPSTK